MKSIWCRSILGFGMGTLLTGSPLQAELPRVALEPVFPALKLERPVWLTEVPDGSGRVVIVEQRGKATILPKTGAGAEATEFLNIENRKPHVDNEEGFLSLAFHPQFKSNGLLYIYYNQQNPRRSVISELKISTTDPRKADLSSERILMTVPQPYGNHKGGQVSFGPDGYLYIGLGDGGAANDPHGNGQNTAVLLGKLLRIDVNSRTTVPKRRGRNDTNLEYGIPMDNPLVGEPDRYGVRPEIYAYGLRNPWRFSWDRETGDLWVGDVGQNEWEEIDLVVKGGNYGWAVREGFHHFKPGPDGARFLDPVIEYPHNATLKSQARFPNHSPGLSVTGGYVYRGHKYPALRGVYVYADFNLGTIWGLRYAHGKVTEYGTLLDQPKNVASFAETADGEIYVLCFDDKIFHLTVPGH
ncbi:MAG TPA: PQQ-dependent sugar dehydrogenase [Verrucomicrobiota bacterium]|nr:PQQ-dependent sugar dehydrogenase [Verrucomicrobiota bacterium]HNT14048.1 PQQ-dependent sugar dehydrogenase [Verrucomicrobiota bacterium]